MSLLIELRKLNVELTIDAFSGVLATLKIRLILMEFVRRTVQSPLVLFLTRIGGLIHLYITFICKQWKFKKTGGVVGELFTYQSLTIRILGWILRGQTGDAGGDIENQRPGYMRLPYGMGERYTDESESEVATEHTDIPATSPFPSFSYSGSANGKTPSAQALDRTGKRLHSRSRLDRDVRQKSLRDVGKSHSELGLSARATPHHKVPDLTAVNAASCMSQAERELPVYMRRVAN